MRFTVYIEREQTLELNYMWLPTFVGMNTELKKELELHVGPLVAGKVLDDELLDEVDEAIIKFILGKYPIPGLEEYLRGLSAVDDQNEVD